MSHLMSNGYWKKRWEDESIPWHQNCKNRSLWEHIHLMKNEVNSRDAGLFFVPMCGKAVDLRCLYDEGYRVLGVEISEKAVMDFFEENELEFEKKSDDRIGTVYSTLDGRLRIINGDVLKLTTEVVGEKISMVWDRGAFGSINKESREGYAKMLTELVTPTAKVLIETYRYKEWFFNGPPYGVTEDLLQALFDGHFHIENIQCVDLVTNKDYVYDRRALGFLKTTSLFLDLHLMTVK